MLSGSYKQDQIKHGEVKTAVCEMKHGLVELTAS